MITKRGKKIARLLPMEEKPEKLVGRTKGTVKIHGDIFSTGEKWDADSDNPDMSLYNLK